MPHQTAIESPTPRSGFKAAGRTPDAPDRSLQPFERIRDSADDLRTQALKQFADTTALWIEATSKQNDTTEIMLDAWHRSMRNRLRLLEETSETAAEAWRHARQSASASLQGILQANVRTIQELARPSAGREADVTPPLVAGQWLTIVAQGWESFFQATSPQAEKAVSATQALQEPTVQVRKEPAKDTAKPLAHSGQ
ncbi:hypothetical protein J2847_006582 [Azospirillum agricola]|uniref:hypothetical protein n=1 Tax=Azospirillum agricola TaxID=1720247 RepID=UPI001AE2C34F|nr:hypothetical protein [Azospirillum agricola]MBP2233245.1 hypothetical protein [Azospirillum agricola]